MDGEDSVEAMMNGFVSFWFRNGGREIVNPVDIKGVRPRREGGSAIRLLNDRILLTSVALGDVVEALEAAGWGDAAV